MKNIRKFLILLTILFSYSFGQDEVKLEYFDTPGGYTESLGDDECMYTDECSIKQKTTYRDGIKHGPFTAYEQIRGYNFLSMEGNHVDGKIKGQIKSYEWGRLSKIMTIGEPCPCPMKVFSGDSNEELVAEGNVDGAMEQQGLWKFYGDDGVLESERTYIDNQLYAYTSYEYYDDGQLSSSKSRINISWDGKLTPLPHGEEIYYYPSGQLGAKKSFYYGSRDGLWESFFPDGQIDEKGRYVAPEDPNEAMGIHKIKVGEWNSFYENGQLYSSTTYDEKGLMQGELIIYFDDGSKKREGLVIDGKDDGPTKQWWSNGNLKYEGQHKLGVMYGIWKAYDEDGVLIDETAFDYEEEKRKYDNRTRVTPVEY